MSDESKKYTVVGWQTDAGEIAAKLMQDCEGPVFAFANLLGLGKVLFRRDAKDAPLYWLPLEDYPLHESQQEFVKGYKPCTPLTAAFASVHKLL